MEKALAIVLAAGEGRRMGMPKALLKYDETHSFLSRLCATFEEAGCEVLVVAGAEADRVAKMHPNISIVRNDGWEQGQLSSVRVGLSEALKRGADLVLVHPVDMPEVQAATVAALRKQALGDGALPLYDGQRGHPLALPAAAAREVLKRDAPPLADATFRMHLQGVDVPDPGTVVNFNEPADYRRVFGRDPVGAQH